MEAIFVGIKWKTGTKEEAIAAAKAILPWEAGDFEEEDGGEHDDGTKWVVGNLDLEDGSYEAIEEEDGYEGDDGNVTVEIETP